VGQAALDAAFDAGEDVDGGVEDDEDAEEPVESFDDEDDDEPADSFEPSFDGASAFTAPSAAFSAEPAEPRLSVR
jgi:hypothetical protein